MGVVSLMVLLMGISIVSLVCWIMTLVKIFKENIGLGILGLLCNLFAYIYGWVKCKEYDHKKLMLLWTICILIMIPLWIAMAVLCTTTIDPQMPRPILDGMPSY